MEAGYRIAAVRGDIIKYQYRYPLTLTLSPQQLGEREKKRFFPPERDHRQESKP